MNSADRRNTFNRAVFGGLLAEAGIKSPLGRKSYSYVNVLSEKINGLYEIWHSTGSASRDRWEPKAECSMKNGCSTSENDR
jgi:hypothetical protein